MTIEQRFEKIVTEALQLSLDDYMPEKTFAELGADSLDEVEILMRVEEEFNIEIPDKEAEKIKTMQQAIDYLNNQETE